MDLFLYCLEKIHMETTKMPEIKFGESNANTELTSIEQGEQMRKKMEQYFGKVETILCDFTGIETVTREFAEECFGKLFDSRKDGDVNTNIQFKNASSHIPRIIAAVVMIRMKTIT